MARLDIVVLGATGVTGQCIIKQAILASQKTPFTWGVAGRSESKLNAVLKEIEEKTGSDTSKVSRIVSNIEDTASLYYLCGQCTVLVNCCGPYLTYGEKVVKACIQTQTHYIDISAEPLFQRVLYEQYNEIGREANIFIIPSCSSISMCNDVGLLFLERQFFGTLNSVETFARIIVEDVNNIINVTSWESLLLNIQDLLSVLKVSELYSAKSDLQRKWIKKSPVKKWGISFDYYQLETINRTQKYLYENYGKRSVKCKTFLQFEKLTTILLLVLLMIVYAVLTKWKITKNLLMRNPKIFSLGIICPREESSVKIAKSHIEILLFGQGWDSNVNDFVNTPSNKKLTAMFSSTATVYEISAIFALYSALTIITERKKMPSISGVLTPGSAFAKTNLLDKLNEDYSFYKVIN